MNSHRSAAYILCQLKRLTIQSRGDPVDIDSLPDCSESAHERRGLEALMCKNTQDAEPKGASFSEGEVPVSEAHHFSGGWLTVGTIMGNDDFCDFVRSTTGEEPEYDNPGHYESLLRQSDNELNVKAEHFRGEGDARIVGVHIAGYSGGATAMDVDSTIEAIEQARQYIEDNFDFEPEVFVHAGYMP